MQEWDDESIVLAARAHGEGGGIITLLTPEHGRMAGYVHGISKLKKNGGVDPGTLVEARWQARLAEQMGRFDLEVMRVYSAQVLHDQARLAALSSACALCAEALPDRQSAPSLYHGLKALLEALSGDYWAVSYIAWEIALLGELGFALDFSRCAVSGESDVAYISPRTGRAVTEAAAGEFKNRLLPIPEFLKPHGDKERAGTPEDIETGLLLTGYFLEHWVFAHHTGNMPGSRLRLAQLFATNKD